MSFLGWKPLPGLRLKSEYVHEGELYVIMEFPKGPLWRRILGWFGIC